VEAVAEVEAEVEVEAVAPKAATPSPLMEQSLLPVYNDRVMRNSGCQPPSATHCLTGAQSRKMTGSVRWKTYPPTRQLRLRSTQTNPTVRQRGLALRMI
jgi:hypothetical protein